MLGGADNKERNLLNSILEFNSEARLKTKADNKKRKDFYKSENALYERRELVLNTFKRILFEFLLKPT